MTSAERGRGRRGEKGREEGKGSVTIEIIKKGPTSWEHRCHTCATVYRYTLDDLMVRGSWGGGHVKCPVCGTNHSHTASATPSSRWTLFAPRGT